MKMGKFSLALLLGVLLVGTTSAFAGLVNGGFETGDFTGWSVDGYAAVVGAGCSGIYPYHCASPVEGSYMALLEAGATPIATLSAELGTNIGLVYPNATYGTAIWQTVYVTAGTPLNFSVDFLGNDYLPFDDTAILTAFVIENGANASYFLSDIAAVGDYGTSGWMTFAPFGTATYTGHYTIGFAVFNQVDNVLDSQLLVDGVQFGAVPEPGSLLLMGSGVLGLGGLLRRKLKM